MTRHILVVDDDPLQVRTAELTISNLLGYHVSRAYGGQEALDFIASKEGKSLDAILLDLSMPDMDGMEVLSVIRTKRPEVPVIIHTAHGDVEIALEALKAGAVDYVNKNDGPERLQICVENVLRINRLEHHVSRLQRSVEGCVAFDDIIGTSKAIKSTKEMAKRGANSNIPVLVKGPSGVGKELFSRAIHGSSSRQGKPFVAVNCGAIPENLVESVLFGHERGAFTGAVEKSLGKFREANGGTLFLDEVGELKPDIQVKLLRALQEGEVDAVGAGKPVKVDVRIISATNRDLKQDVTDGVFREDLYYRLNVFPLDVPALKERKEDVRGLLEHFIDVIAVMEHKKISGITDECAALLGEYEWQGNVRQLENAVYRAVVLCDEDVLDVVDFAHVINAMVMDNGVEALSSMHAATDTLLAQQSHVISLLQNDQQIRSMSDVEAEVIRIALEHYHGKISEAARRLGLGRSTLYRKMQEYNIQDQKAVNE